MSKNVFSKQISMIEKLIYRSFNEKITLDFCRFKLQSLESSFLLALTFAECQTDHMCMCTMQLTKQDIRNFGTKFTKPQAVTQFISVNTVYQMCRVNYICAVQRASNKSITFI